LAIAQSAPQKSLKGISEVNIVIEDLNDDAKACGIRVDALDAAVRIPISSTKITVSGGMFAPMLYARVVAVRPTPTSCAVYVSLNAQKLLWLQPGAALMDFELAGVWDNGAILSGPTYDMGKRVSDALEGQTKRFIGAWLRSN
jgi:hypothetical protein